MTFEEFLISKKIDSLAFKRHEKSMWTSWELLYNQIHPNSFLHQKMFLINNVRRRFQLDTSDAVVSTATPDDTGQTPTSTGSVTKPKIRMKPKTTIQPKPNIQPKPKVQAKPQIKPKIQAKAQAKPKVKPVIKRSKPDTENES